MLRHRITRSAGRRFSSAARPPGAKLFEVDEAVAILVDTFEGTSHLLDAKKDSQTVEQLAKFRDIDLRVVVPVNAVEARPQRIRIHARSLFQFAAVGALVCSGCRADTQNADSAAITSAQGVDPTASAQQVPRARPDAHQAVTPSASNAAETLPPLQATWLEELSATDGRVVVAPPLGATAPRQLAMHGAGDRADWACGGWRLAAQANAFIACPQGQRMTADTFAWASPASLAARAEAARAAAEARFTGYIAQGAMIYAGFSQGANFAAAFLRSNAHRFPIAILAEGGYSFAGSPNFAAGFASAGGRRVALVCGTPACFASARRSRKVLEANGIETLVIGDPQAGHNLNDRMQKALQAAWPQISAPLARAAH